MDPAFLPETDFKLFGDFLRIGFMIAGPQPAAVDRLAVLRPCFASAWSEIGVSATKTV